MAKTRIKFEDGTSVIFDGTPTKKDIEEVAKSLALKKKQSSPVQPKDRIIGTGEKVAMTLGDISGAKKLGQGLSTVGSKIPEQIGNINAADLQSVTKLTQAIHNQADPVKKQRLVDSLKNIYGVGFQSPTATDINAGFGLSNKEVLGSAAQTGLSILGAGSLAGAGTRNFALGKGTSVSGAISKVLPFSRGAGVASKAIEGGALGYGFDVAQKATDNKDNIYKPGVGTAVGTGLPFVSSVIGGLLKRGVGLTTGTGTEVIDRALKNPDAVGEAIGNLKSSEQKLSLISRAKTAIYDFLGERGDEFSRNISRMTSKQPISKNIVIDEFTKQIDKFGGKIKDGQLLFKNSQLTGQDINDLKKVWSVVSKWSDVTPQGYDRLRQSIGNHISQFNATGNSRASSILGNVKKVLTGTMEKNIEGYGATLSTYGKKTQLAKEVLKELNLGGSAKESTQINSVLRLFKKDPEVIKKLTQIMGKQDANQLLDDLSGAILSEWLPTGKVSNALRLLTATGIGFTNPSALVGLPLASPRIVGRGATYVGKAVQRGVGTGIKRTLTKLGSKVNP